MGDAGGRLVQAEEDLPVLAFTQVLVQQLYVEPVADEK